MAPAANLPDEGNSNPIGNIGPVKPLGDRVLKVLYLFAGRKRKNDIKTRLQLKAAAKHIALQMEELDVLQHGEADDLLDDKVWRFVLERIGAGEWDFIVSTPPCNDFSRAKFANSRGPRPNRSRQHPRGFPWLKDQAKVKADNMNLLIERSWDAMRAGARSQAKSGWLTEHPEDLGDTSNGGCPASMWQFKEVQAFIQEENALEGALYQCRYPGGRSSKPTRLASSAKGLKKMVHLGRPTFTKKMLYKGPLPPKCSHKRHKPILGWNEALGKFNTDASSEYPTGMSDDIADAIVEDFENQHGGQVGALPP